MEQPPEKDHQIHDFDLNCLPATEYTTSPKSGEKEGSSTDFDEYTSLPPHNPSSQKPGEKEGSDIDQNCFLPDLPDNPNPEKPGDKKESSDIDEISSLPTLPEGPKKSDEKDSSDQVDENSSEKPQDHNESSEEQQYYDRYNRYYDSFERKYNCFSLSVNEKSHLEQGNQIIMPASAFEVLLDTGVEYPMLFEIRNELKERVSHCGVYEFTAQEGSVFLPDWMMENLQLQNGNAVSLKNATLEKGTFIKLQPHSTDFLSILNPKAALEETLSANFFCLTTGDTIKVNYDNKEFLVNIVETKPSNAICIIDTDCEVDFVPPLDYKEPEQPVQSTKDEPGKEGQKFVPFTGLSRRLDEEPAEELALPDSGSFKEENQTIDTAPIMATESEIRSHKRPAKVVFGSASHVNKRKGLKTEDVKAETLKKEQFQPFTGKKYTLEG